MLGPSLDPVTRRQVQVAHGERQDAGLCPSSSGSSGWHPMSPDRGVPIAIRLR
jgi:hypothetical protein